MSACRADVSQPLHAAARPAMMQWAGGELTMRRRKKRRKRRVLPQLSVAKILAWADAHHQRYGRRSLAGARRTCARGRAGDEHLVMGSLGWVRV
jgi:hypothetical protein